MRNEKSLIQTSGRAARNIDGMVIMYADKITKSMQSTIDETKRRRKIQEDYNIKNNIIPRSVTKTKQSILAQTRVAKNSDDFMLGFHSKIELDPIIQNMTPEEIEKIISTTEKQMNEVAKELDFFEAARLRDEIVELKSIKKKKLDSR